MYLDQEELIIDSFAGGGGASTAILMATGRHPDVAINHDPEAVAMHMANHPTTEHFCQSIYQVDPDDIIRKHQKRIGLAWFSPDCTHHSKARGGKPKQKHIRDLAWVVVHWAERGTYKGQRPRIIAVENVEEFKDWGPLLDDGKPCPIQKGFEFQRWVKALRKLGYVVEWKELRASDYGAPTIRKRLFVIARCDGLPIVWPEESHGPGRANPYRTAAECIDWSIPCPSIFLSKEEGRAIGVKRPLADATMRRIARGIDRFVIKSKHPFVVRCAHGDQDKSGRKRGKGEHSLSEPLPTVTASGEFALATPFMAKFRGESPGTDIAAPLHTITAGGKSARPAGTPHGMGIIMPIITEHANASTARSWDAEEPLRTQCASVKGGHFAVCAAGLVQTGYGEANGQKPRCLDIEKPLGTIVGSGKHALTAAFLAKHYGGNETPGTPLDKAASTITAVDHHALVATHMQRHFGTSIGSATDEPIGTTTSKAKTSLVASSMVKLRGDNTGSPADEPLHTISAGGTHHAEVRAFLMKYYGTDGTPELTDPMHTITAKDRFGLVMVGGEEYCIVDIGMRMLSPRELFNAQGFPPDYIIDPVCNGRKLPKHAQVRMCGNSVSPQPAAALLAANLAATLKMKRVRAAGNAAAMGF